MKIGVTNQFVQKQLSQLYTAKKQSESTHLPQNKTNLKKNKYAH